MKLFSILFSIYLLVLVCQPCTDKADCNTEHHTTQIHTEHEHEDETCPPFCICNCCGNTIVTFSNIQIFQVSELFISEKIKDDYSFKISSNFFVNIWQPPKINS